MSDELFRLWNVFLLAEVCGWGALGPGKFIWELARLCRWLTLILARFFRDELNGKLVWSG